MLKRFSMEQFYHQKPEINIPLTTEILSLMLWKVYTVELKNLKMILSFNNLFHVKVRDNEITQVSSPQVKPHNTLSSIVFNFENKVSIFPFFPFTLLPRLTAIIFRSSRQRGRREIKLRHERNVSSLPKRKYSIK